MPALTFFDFTFRILFLIIVNGEKNFMPRSKYEEIYKKIRDDIILGKYTNGDYLPSENEYVNHFGCTRNTIRRALYMLEQEGFVLPQHGKGVQVIYKDEEGSIFTIGGIESFAEAAARSSQKVRTKVITFRKITADKAVSLTTGFDIGTELWFIERIRTVDGRALIFDTNYYLVNEVPGLTKEIAAKSVYNYIENTLGMIITTSRRRITAEKADIKDKEYLDLGTKDFILCVTGQVFNSKGVMFEYTMSRHVPDGVCFVETAVRQKK